MSGFREELEERFNQASAEEQSPENLGTNDGGQEALEQVEQPVIDEYLEAPGSYKKEYSESFKALTPEMRKYLHEREREVAQGFSKINNQYGWVNSEFNNRAERLKTAGYNNPQEYFNTLLQIEDALAKDPKSVIEALTREYGISQDSQDDQSFVMNKFGQIEQQISSFNQFVNNWQQEQGKKAYDSFVNAKNDDGSQKFSYIKNEEVRKEMIALIEKGLCPDLETAYEKAVWSAPSVRDELIKAKSQSELTAKAKEAEKAMTAGFSPKGKGGGVNEPSSLREDLERQFAGLE